MNVGRLIKLHAQWMKQLPTVYPFYAVKCNNNPVILKVLAALGAGFDCASKVRIVCKIWRFPSVSANTELSQQGIVLYIAWMPII